MCGKENDCCGPNDDEHTGCCEPHADEPTRCCGPNAAHHGRFPHPPFGGPGFPHPPFGGPGFPHPPFGGPGFPHPPFGGPGFWQALIGQDWETFMPYELQESQTEYIITMPLPGFENKDVKVSMSGENVLIEATREKPAEVKEPKDQNEYRVITSMGRFLWDKPHVEVSVHIDQEIEQDKVKASFSKAILTVRFQKKPPKSFKVEG